AHEIGGEGLTCPSGQWQGVYGIDDDGAVLVRPDGHVAWRTRGGSPDAEDQLWQVLRRVLGLRGSRLPEREHRTDTRMAGGRATLTTGRGSAAPPLSAASRTRTLGSPKAAMVPTATSLPSRILIDPADREAFIRSPRVEAQPPADEGFRHS